MSSTIRGKKCAFRLATTAQIELGVIVITQALIVGINNFGHTKVFVMGVGEKVKGRKWIGLRRRSQGILWEGCLGNRIQRKENR